MANGSPSWSTRSKSSPAIRSTSRSPKQLAQVLFQELGLPVVKKTKTGPSTDADVLEQLAESHPLPKKIVEYRQYAKLKNTYVDALPTMIHPRNGPRSRVVQPGRGRHRPAQLQRPQPAKHPDPHRRRPRNPLGVSSPGPPGWKLLAADYSQIELRILAHYSQDASMCAAFERDEDIHTHRRQPGLRRAARRSHVRQRRSAKAVNFGVIYGQSPFGLAKGLGISQEEAAKFIDGYFATYRGVAEFMVRTLDECRRQGYVATILGRRRAIQGVRPDRPTHAAHRPAQPPAADTCPSGPPSTASSKARRPT